MNRIFKLLVLCCLCGIFGSCDVVVKRMEAKVTESKQQLAPKIRKGLELPAPLTSRPEQILVRKG